LHIRSRTLALVFPWTTSSVSSALFRVISVDV
jgi:hypothetical protein